MRNERFFIWTLIFSLGVAVLGVVSAALEALKARGKEGRAPDQFLSPRRTIRRLFTSAVLIALGTMVLLGVHFLDFSRPGLQFLSYWGIIFLLAAWLFLCPVFDISETRRVYRSRMKVLTEQAAGRPFSSAEAPPKSSEEGGGQRSQRK